MAEAKKSRHIMCCTVRDVIGKGWMTETDLEREVG
jgi:hypothetical protein